VGGVGRRGGVDAGPLIRLSPHAESDLQPLSSETLRASLLSEGGLSVKTVKNVLQCTLSAFFRDARRLGLTSNNALAGMTCVMATWLIHLKLRAGNRGGARPAPETQRPDHARWKGAPRPTGSAVPDPDVDAHGWRSSHTPQAQNGSVVHRGSVGGPGTRAVHSPQTARTQRSLWVPAPACAKP